MHFMGGGSRGGWVDRLRGEGWGTRYGGSGLKKNLQILDLQRLASLHFQLFFYPKAVQS